MDGEEPLHFSEAAFDAEVLRSELPVLVDFWSEGCGGCRQLAPTVDRIAREYAGRARVGKLDVGAHTGIAIRYQIRRIPTLLLFQDGKVVAQYTGAAPLAEIQKMLDAHLARKEKTD
ncbi:MAG: thioredoxin [Acidobacteriia bacterium]|nr:thioredoxin [Terriglobia bacterium]